MFFIPSRENGFEIQVHIPKKESQEKAAIKIFNENSVGHAINVWLKIKIYWIFQEAMIIKIVDKIILFNGLNFLKY